MQESEERCQAVLVLQPLGTEVKPRMLLEFKKPTLQATAGGHAVHDEAKPWVLR